MPSIGGKILGIILYMIPWADSLIFGNHLYMQYPFTQIIQIQNTLTHKNRRENRDHNHHCQTTKPTAHVHPRFRVVTVVFTRSAPARCSIPAGPISLSATRTITTQPNQHHQSGTSANLLLTTHRLASQQLSS